MVDVVQPGIARRIGNRSLCKLSYRQGRSSTTAPQASGLSGKGSKRSLVTRLITFITEISCTNHSLRLCFRITIPSHCLSNSSRPGIQPIPTRLSRVTISILYRIHPLELIISSDETTKRRTQRSIRKCATLFFSIDVRWVRRSQW